MNFLISIRIKLGRYFLRRLTSKLHRERLAVKLKDARNIGIVFNMHSEEEYAAIGNFVKQLQQSGQKVWVLGYTKYRRSPAYFSPKLSYDLILRGDVDFLMWPKSKFITPFIDQPFDILFDLRLTNDFPMAYVVELSKAGFKVGSGKSGEFGPYDIQIDVTKNMTTSELIDQMAYYTNTIDFLNPIVHAKKFKK